VSHFDALRHSGVRIDPTFVLTNEINHDRSDDTLGLSLVAFELATKFDT
jgi:hypothetical protein